jgi:hypothetical protein
MRHAFTHGHVLGAFYRLACRKIACEIAQVALEALGCSIVTEAAPDDAALTVDGVMAGGVVEVRCIHSIGNFARYELACCTAATEKAVDATGKV